MKPFLQNTSIIRKLRAIIFALGLCVLFEFVGTFISSNDFLRGLKELKSTNIAMELVARASSNIFLISHSIDNATVSNPRSPQTQFSIFNTSKKQALEEINSALDQSRDAPEISRMLQKSSHALEKMDLAANELFGKLASKKAADVENIQKQKVQLRSLARTALAPLRASQLELGKKGDREFTAVYRKRFLPLIVSFSIAVGFFVYIFYIGLFTIRNLKHSIGKLLNATDLIARGKFPILAPFLHNDEIGRLTVAFDTMVQKLDLSMQRTSRLQKITAEFSKALDSKEVIETVIHHGKEALGANAGGVCLITANNIATQYTCSQKFTLLILDELIKVHEPIFFESKAKLIAIFPQLKEEPNLPESFAVTPLLVDGMVLGALNFTFSTETKLNFADKDFFVTLSRLASQALLRAQLYESAKRAVEMRNEFLSIASHELKTPITSLKLQLQLARRQVNPDLGQTLTPQKLAQVLKVSEAQVDRLSILVEDLLDIGRMEAGKLTYDFIDIDFFPLVKSVLERFEDALKFANCEVKLDASETFLIRGDAFRIEQVVINLLTNAVKYASGKPIEISISKKNEFGLLIVRDFGMGIQKEKMESIFNRFERAVSSQNISGLGLGLYITKQIVEAHKGTISVESELNSGSQFTVELPLAAIQTI